MGARFVKNILRIVWVVWLAGILIVVIANLKTRGDPQLPILVLKPTPLLAPSNVPEPTISPSPPNTAQPRMLWELNTSELKDLITSVGIVLGGLWAYFKFFRGRVFHARLEPKVTATIVDQGDSKNLIVSMELNNVGLGVVYLSSLTSIDVYETNLATSTQLTGIKWGDSPKTFRAFANHSWIEPEETVRDEIMIRLANADDISHRLVLVVRSENRSIRKRWTSWQKRQTLGGKWSSTCVARKESAQDDTQHQ